MYMVRKLQILLLVRPLSRFLGTSFKKGKQRVPWTELEKARDEYIDPKYLPKQVALKQYYHLRQKDINNILEHWTTRQAAGRAPLCFRKEVGSEPQNDCTQEENGASTGLEPTEGENVQDNEGGHVQEDGPPQGDWNTNRSTEWVHSSPSPGDAARTPNRVCLLPKHGK